MHQENFDKWPNFISNWPAMLPGIYFKERPVLYNRYQLGRGPWIRIDSLTSPEKAYAHGFLPFSKPHQGPQKFFQARSLRVHLNEWNVSKKRRYQQRQWQRFNPQREAMDPQTFLNRFPEASETARNWMTERFGAPFLENQQLRFILSNPLLSTILTWFVNDKLTAFAPLIDGPWGAHYWFAFYNPAPTAPPGHGYLMDFILWTHGHGRPFAYLGSAYGMHSLYKSKGFNGIQFWHDEHWSDDHRALLLLQQAESCPRPERP